MAPKRLPDLYNSAELLAPREIRLFRSGRRLFIEDHEPGFDRIKVEVKAEYTRSDILEKITMPDEVVDAVLNSLRGSGTTSALSVIHLLFPLLARAMAC